MPKIPVEKLLNPVSEAQPCGPPIDEDIVLSNLWREIEAEAKGKPEQQFGETIIEAKAGDWKDVHSKCLKILESSRHLEPAIYLCAAAVELDGLSGLRDGLKLILGIVEKFWSEVHPMPDPDDPEDFYEREGIFEMMSAAFQEASLSGEDLLKFVERTRNAVLAENRQVGRVSYADILAARSNREGAPSKELIVATFTQTDPDSLSQVTSAAVESIELVDSLQNYLDDKLGDNSPNLDHLKTELESIQKAITTFVSGGEDVSGETTAESGQSASVSAGAVSSATAASVAGVPGAVNSRADVVMTLNLVISYYKANEPASPVPLLLQRAKALVNNDFLGIIRNFRPDLERDFLAILGATDASDDNVNIPVQAPPPPRPSQPATKPQPQQSKPDNDPWASASF